MGAALQPLPVLVGAIVIGGQSSSSSSRSGLFFADAAAAASPGAAIRGVAPSDLPKYAAAGDAQDGGEDFVCFSERGAAAASPRRLPKSVVNDEYCDCADGSDEPGTGACAGQQDTMFYCPNEESLPKYVYASMVNDGVCDCCDGSDEWRRPDACANSCKAEGAELHRTLASREKNLLDGLELRRSLVEKAKKDRGSMQEELESLKKEMQTLEDAEKLADETHQAAVAVVAKIEKEEAEKKAKAEAEAAAKQTTAAEPKEEAAAPKDPPAVATAGSDVEETKATDATPPAGQADKPPAADAPKQEDKAVVSEYAKWMEGAEKALGEEDKMGAEAKAEPATQKADAGAEKPTPTPRPKRERPSAWAKFKDDVWKQLSGVWQSLFGKGLTPEEKAREAAKKKLDAAKAVVKKKSDRKDELEAKLASVASESDHDLAFASLDGKCLSKTLGEYTYEVCFFKQAKQTSTSVGRWKKWESSRVALFDGGAWCPGGPERSLRVKFQCGHREDILDITEPSRCTYEATATHPGACSEEALQDLEKARGPRRPRDEEL
eukprot:TRINITY_DN47670_c0_g1_i1.p1 TRINITY_DN47670_c0_g1~~TRINITY_DN47670_c0_g1_i1.p1  ORF type:complete len:550 (-),score=215.06 TRINITY_DN47670_c0_g1_i1:15-1664(-)